VGASRRFAAGRPAAGVSSSGSSHRADTGLRRTFPGRWQAKSTSGASVDAHEREADHVADQVLGRAPAPGRLTAALPFTSQDADPPEDWRGGGQPLPAAERHLFEARLGHGLSDVRLHLDAPAGAIARGLRARAVTYGRHIAFEPGAYEPATDDGRHLLAHELAHVIQQGAAGPAGARAVHPGPRPVAVSGRVRPTLQLQPKDPAKPATSELERELAEWARRNRKSIDPADPFYAFNLQEYAWTLVVVPSSIDPVAKPKGKAERRTWEKKFEKAGILAKMILQGGPAVEQKEGRAAMILGVLARAGFVEAAFETTKAMQANETKEQAYESILGQAELATPATLRTISRHHVSTKGISGNPVVDRFTDVSGSFEKRLNADQLTGLLDPIISAHEKDPVIVDLLAEVLVHTARYRQPFSDWMWRAGKSELLFKVLESKYFIEPGYGPTVFPEVGELKLEKDMPWVYENKQRFLVDYVVQLGRETGVAIAAPTKRDIKSLRAWLDVETEHIAQAVAKKFPTDPAAWITMYKRLTDAFFYHVEGRGVTPDLTGKLAGLKPSAPKKMRLEADCDVLATYAMRFFSAVRDPANPAFVGFEPVGYMAISPPGNDGHATALMRRGGRYYVVSNKEVIMTAVAESPPKEATGSKKEAALRAMLNVALDIYEPRPTKFSVFYADALAGGAMPRPLARTEPSTRREDLEP
jgi:Domain of unknown function (DUF4157)